MTSNDFVSIAIAILPIFLQLYTSSSKQLFTNGDKIHAAKSLHRLGLEECFEGIICFETLNPTKGSSSNDDDSNAEGLEQTPGAEIFDILEHFSQPNAGSDLPKTPILCKPSEVAMEKALKIANIDPHKTVS